VRSQGVSGAGKTTLLDVLASRVTMGVVTGLMHVDGRQRDASFARKTGYCMQQDLHLETSTVREALAFSAILRQPAHISHQEKLDYVEEVIKLLEMEPYADAVVGVPGEGLNVEQRKRLTIGVELVAKPELLLFLDEPSSGLDSQTSYAIVDLLVKLKNHGVSVGLRLTSLPGTDVAYISSKPSYAPFISPQPCYSNDSIVFSSWLRVVGPSISAQLAPNLRS
jgi:ATP-binding cassette, subfamily G (WHITE), member 2, PDR